MNEYSLAKVQLYIYTVVDLNGRADKVTILSLSLLSSENTGIHTREMPADSRLLSAGISYLRDMNGVYSS